MKYETYKEINDLLDLVKKDLDRHENNSVFDRANNEIIKNVLEVLKEINKIHYCENDLE